MAMILLSGAAAREQPFAPTQTNLREKRVEIPFRIVAGGLLEIEVSVNSIPVHCMVDTGASASLVSEKLVKAASLGVYKLSRVRMQDAGGNQRTEKVAWMNHCTLSSELDFIRLDAVEADLKSLGDKDHPIDLVLCPGAFANVLLTIDYPKHRLRFERGTLPAEDGKEILPMWIDRSGHLVIDAAMGKHALRLLLDTGCTAGLVLPGNFLPIAEAGELLASAQSQFYYGTGIFDVHRGTQELHVGRHTFAHPLYVTSDRRGIGQPVMGAAYLRYFAVTFDMEHRRVRFARDDTNPIEVPVPLILTFQFDPGTGVVTSVRDGGSAEKQGIHVGDRIALIENMSVKEFMAGKVPKGLKHPGFITLRVTRNGRAPFAAMIPLQDIQGTP